MAEVIIHTSNELIIEGVSKEHLNAVLYIALAVINGDDPRDYDLSHEDKLVETIMKTLEQLKRQ